MKYSKTRFLNNLAKIMLDKEYKIGQIETACEVSPGYFSRVKKDNNDTLCPNMETMCLLSEFLGFSIDNLVNGYMGSLTKDEMTIVEFMDTLISETNKNTINWDIFSFAEFINDKDSNGLIDQDYNCNCLYKSLFTDFMGIPDEPICKLEYINNKLLLLKINETYELYMLTKGHLKNVSYATSDGKEMIHKTMKNLYDSAVQSGKNLKIDQETKEGINDMMDLLKLPF